MYDYLYMQKFTQIIYIIVYITLLKTLKHHVQYT